MDTVINFVQDKIQEVRMAGKNTYNFKKHDFQKRLNESYKIREKYPNRIPIIVQRAKQCDTVPDIDRHKFLAPVDLTMGQFMYVIRQRIKLRPEVSIYLMVGDDYTMPATSQLLSLIYQEHGDNDGFLYITYTGESTFG